MIKLLDDIYTWSVFSDEKQLNFNGWFIQNQSSSFGNVVIDPPQPSEKDLTSTANNYYQSASSPQGFRHTGKI